MSELSDLRASLLKTIGELRAENERLREQRDSAEQCAGESEERAALAEGELNQLRRELRRSSQITEGIPDEVVERAAAEYAEKHHVLGTESLSVVHRRAMRAALEAVWPAPQPFCQCLHKLTTKES